MPRMVPGDKRYDDESELTSYVWEHYKHHFTPLEIKAGWDFFHVDKKARVGSRHAIQRRRELAEDPAVRAALAEGVGAFRLRCVERVIRDRPRVNINRCPKCSRIVRTPNARQCLWCGHDWHGPRRRAVEQ